MRVPKIHKKIDQFLASRSKAGMKEAEEALDKGDGVKLTEMVADTLAHGFRGIFPPEHLVYDLTRLSEADLSFLVKKWRMPFGMEERAVEALMDIFCLPRTNHGRFLGKLLDALVSENPELADLASRKGVNKGVIVGGCCSRMTLEDIIDYLDQGTKLTDSGAFKRKDGSGPEYKKHNDYLTRIGCRPGYFPSLANLKRACDAVRADVALITKGARLGL